MYIQKENAKLTFAQATKEQCNETLKLYVQVLSNCRTHKDVSFCFNYLTLRQLPPNIGKENVVQPRIVRIACGGGALCL